VLDPLGMDSSWFPQRWPADDTPVVTGYQLDEEGDFRPAPAQVGTVRAATGLWTTTADLLRFGLGWSSLLPGELASEALRPRTSPLNDTMATWGLGWRVNQTLGVAGHAEPQPRHLRFAGHASRQPPDPRRHDQPQHSHRAGQRTGGPGDRRRSGAGELKVIQTGQRFAVLVPSAMGYARLPSLSRQRCTANVRKPAQTNHVDTPQNTKFAGGSRLSPARRGLPVSANTRGLDAIAGWYLAPPVSL
jgi:hypothetical protein